MKFKTLGKLILACAASLSLAAVASASSTPDMVVPMGSDTYSITREAKTAFTRDTDKLKAEVNDAAVRFCAAQGKQMRVISLTGNVPRFSMGYASAKIVFRALNAGDPGLTSDASASVEVAEKTMSTDELYAALVKLDDLRKKGILTDDEFQAEKKKLLGRSK